MLVARPAAALGLLVVLACSSHSFTQLDACPHAGATAYGGAFGQGPCYLASATPAGACEKWTKCTTCTVGVVCSDGSTAGDYPETQCTCGASGTWSCDPGPANASGCTSLPPRDAASPPSEPCGLGFVCPEAGTDIDCQPVVPAANAVLCTLACGALVQATCPGVGFLVLKRCARSRKPSRSTD